MLTRSASKKKKTASPVKSVEKFDDPSAAALNNVVENTQVIIPSFSIPNGNGCVSSPMVNMSFSVLPQKNDIDNDSKIIFNFGGIVINMSRDDSKTDGESNTMTNNDSKSSVTSPKSTEEGNTPCKQNVSGNESYHKFLPVGTSSARKRKRSQLRQDRASEWDTEFDSDSSLGLFPVKKRDEDMSSIDETEVNSFYKGILVNGGYTRDTFAKKPVVEIVPVSEEEVQSWSNLNSSCSTTMDEDSTEEQSSNVEASDYEMVRRKKLLEILKRIDLSVSKQHAKEKEIVRENGNSFHKPVLKECNNNNNNCIEKAAGVRKKFDPEWRTRVFGDFRGKFHGSSETDEGYNEEETDWLVKYIHDQDSIQTVIFDGESEENQNTVPPMGEIPTLVEGLVNRLKIPVLHDSAKGGGSPDCGTTLIHDEKLPAENKTLERCSEDERQHTEEGNREKSEKHPKRNRSSRGRKKTVSVGSVTDETRNETVIRYSAIQDGEMQYTDRGKLLSLQLECIKQEIVSREAEIKQSPPSKTVKSTRKSKIREKDDVSLGRRRSLRLQEYTEPKSATKTRGRPRKSLKELPDNNVAVTPKSSRGKTLRREATESMERKKGKVDDPPKTPKLTEVSENDGEENGLSSRRSRKLTKEEETGKNEIVVEEPESTPRKRGSLRKTSHIDEKDGGTKVKSCSKSRKSVSPMKNPTEEATELDEKAVEEVSSPLKKKKEAAERLRAEEERLGQRQLREREPVVMSSAKKSKSPVTPRTVEEVSVRVETSVQSTPKKKSPKGGKSSVARQILVEECLNTEVESPSTRQTEELPDEKPTEESEEVSMSSPKRGRSISPKKQQQTQGLEGLESPIARTSPRRQKSKSPQKRHVEEPKPNEDRQEAEETKAAPSPKRQKSKSPQKKYVEEREPECEVAEMRVASPPKLQKSESPGKKRVEERESEESDVEMPVLSPTRQKSVTPKKQQEETEERVSEKYMCDVSPHKQRMMKKATRQQDVEVFLTDDSDSEVVEMSSPKQQKSRSPKKAVGLQGSESDVVAVVSRQESRSPKKHVEPEAGDKKSDGGESCVVSSPKGKKCESPGKKRLEERCSEGIESNDVEVSLPSPKRQKSKSPKRKHLEEEGMDENESEDASENAACLKGQKTKSPKKKHMEEQEVDENESEDASENAACLKGQKTKSPKKKHMEEQEVDESDASENAACLKGEKTKSPKKKHVEEVDERESEDVDICTTPSKQQESKTWKKKRIEERKDEEDSEDAAAVSSPMQQISKWPQKRHHAEEQEKDDSDEDVTQPSKRHKSKSPWKNLTEEPEDNVSRGEKASKSVETHAGSSRKHKKKKLVGGLNAERKRTDEMVGRMEWNGMNEKNPDKNRLQPKSKRKDKQKADEKDVGMSIPKLGHDFLASISSQKTFINAGNKVNGDGEGMKKKKKNRRRRKNKMLKSFLAGEGYIPLEVGGATQFGVVGLDKFKFPARHPAFDLKRDLLYGSRVKRIPYSQLQSYKMKVESRAMRF